MSERKTSVFVSPGFPAFYFPDILWFLAQQIVLCSRLIPRLPSSSFPFTFTLFNLISCLSPPHNLLFADQQFSTAITNQFFSPFPFSFLTTLLPFFYPNLASIFHFHFESSPRLLSTITPFLRIHALSTPLSDFRLDSFLCLSPINLFSSFHIYYIYSNSCLIYHL